MRVFVEEAAGISKYKERRKETSNRIKRTKENLCRLEIRKKKVWSGSGYRGLRICIRGIIIKKAPLFTDPGQNRGYS